MQSELFQTYENNSKIWEISELNASIRKALEGSHSNLWVRGEISNLKSHSSGHHYFQIKDSLCQIKAVLFRGDARNQFSLPKEGGNFVIFGDLTVYEPRGDYQIRVKHLMEEGAGSLRMEFERLKNQLTLEGLFDNDIKLSIPRFSVRLGLVTSSEGAAIKDFISILERKSWKGQIVLAPSLVQGHSAAEQLIESIEKIESLKNPVDVVILTRGGGSIEDLWAFNDEKLVRKIAACKIPVISAIGHQTDFVLTDFVADQRAETPSAAAELLSVGYLEQIQKLDLLTSNLNETVKRSIEKVSDILNLLCLRLKSVSPTHQIELANQKLDDLYGRLSLSMSHLLEQKKSSLSFLHNRLENLNVDNTLKKGYSIIKNIDGKTITSISELEKQKKIGVLLKDGEKKIEIQSRN